MTMSSVKSVKIIALLFGQAREWAGASTLELEIETPATVQSAFAVLKLRHPKLAEIERSVLFAFTEEYASPSNQLSDGARLAVLPPVSGGEGEAGDIFEITREPIDIA